MKRPIKLYLSYVEWPQQDRICWEAAFDTGIDLFDDCGPAAHLADRTRRQLEYGYGKYLALLTARHPELLGCPPGERVNRKIVEEYAKWQPATCGGVTLSIYLYHLWLVLRYICPNKDWSWLLTISKRIAAQAKKKPEKHHQVTTEILYALGIELTDHAMGKPAGSRTRQTTYRDGLLISMTALFPLRRRTLAALRIGKHLVRSGDTWALDIPAEDMKTKRPIDFPISAELELSTRIDFYLKQIRSHIPGARKHDYLWASTRGRPMGDGAIYNTVRRRTRKALGFPVNLHRFRLAAGTFWSIRDPANVRGSKDLLGHASFATTEKYYIMAQSRLAGRALARTIDNVRKGPAVS